MVCQVIVDPVKEVDFDAAIVSLSCWFDHEWTAIDESQGPGTTAA
jgi:hypothetical protein